MYCDIEYFCATKYLYPVVFSNFHISKIYTLNKCIRYVSCYNFPVLHRHSFEQDNFAYFVTFTCCLTIMFCLVDYCNC